MPGSQDVFQIGSWTVEPELDRISCSKASITLRSQVMEVLLFLARHEGKVVSTEQLMNQVWAGKIVTDGTIYNTLSELRNALASADDAQKYIETIPKKGYRLVAEVQNLVTLSPGSARRFVHRKFVLSGLAILGLVILAVVSTTRTVGPHSADGEQRNTDTVRRFTVELPRELLDLRTIFNPVVISRDGRRLVFSGAPDNASLIYSRAIDEFDVAPISGTESSAGVMALSPDGDWIAFVDLRDGVLKKVPISGGIAATLCDPGGKIWSMAWGPDDDIVYASAAYPGLMQVSSSGGLPQRLTMPEPGIFHKQPGFSPDGSVLFFTVGERGSTTRASDRISVLSLRSGEQKDLIAGASPQTIRDNVLIYYKDRALWVATFDSGSLQISSESLPVADAVHYEDFAHFSVSSDGTLVYVADAHLKRRKLTWVDRDGKETAIPIEPKAYVMPRISPDGERLAVVIEESASADLWLYSLSRATMTRLTNDESREASPVWSNDGSFIVYSSNRVDNLFRVTTNGTNSVARLTNSEKYQFAYSITPDDRKVVFSEGSSNNLPSDIALLTIDSDEQPEVLLSSQFNEFEPALSPDGRFLAFASNRSGVNEVYVRAFPDISGWEIQISIGGGTQPHWNPAGSELIYRGPSDLMSVDITTDPEFRPEQPQPLLSLGDYLNYDMGNFDIAPDGQQFLMVKHADANAFPVSRVVIVQNWLNNIAERLDAN